MENNGEAPNGLGTGFVRDPDDVMMGGVEGDVEADVTKGLESEKKPQ